MLDLLCAAEAEVQRLGALVGQPLGEGVEEGGAGGAGVAADDHAGGPEGAREGPADAPHEGGVEVLAEAARVLRPGGPVALTFSNRCFPTKAVRGWLATDDDGRCAIVAEYLRRAGGFTEPEVSLRTPAGRERGGRYRGDPLHAVVARRLGQSPPV